MRATNIGQIVGWCQYVKKNLNWMSIWNRKVWDWFLLVIVEWTDWTKWNIFKCTNFMNVCDCNWNQTNEKCEKIFILNWDKWILEVAWYEWKWKDRWKKKNSECNKT